MLYTVEKHFRIPRSDHVIPNASLGGMRKTHKVSEGAGVVVCALLHACLNTFPGKSESS